MKAFRDIRVLPVVVVAIFGFAVLKIAGLVLDGGYVFDYNPNATKTSWAQDSFNFPTGRAQNKADLTDVTGSIDEKKDTRKEEGKKEEAKKDEKKDEKSKDEAPKPAAPAAEAVKTDGTVLYPAPGQPVSASERAVLERLQARRQELDARAREIDIRESLLKAAEKKSEAKVEELKATEAKISTETEQKNQAEAARFKGIITMYEAMKPKDAAKVFDRLEMPVLYQIASQIAPRKMSDILGLMQPEVAERLTTEMARRASSDQSASAEVLPKIEGKMLPQKLN
jgi:flagellar motility protein MotE (MotC chaperone)